MAGNYSATRSTSAAAPLAYFLTGASIYAADFLDRSDEWRDVIKIPGLGRRLRVWIGT